MGYLRIPSFVSTPEARGHPRRGASRPGRAHLTLQPSSYIDLTLVYRPGVARSAAVRYAVTGSTSSSGTSWPFAHISPSLKHVEAGCALPAENRIARLRSPGANDLLGDHVLEGEQLGPGATAQAFPEHSGARVLEKSWGHVR